MSIHPSLRKARGGSSNRSVYSRQERMEILRSLGKMTDESPKATGLPKVKTVKLGKAKKK